MYSNILFLSLIAMTEPNPAKLHPTCANDHSNHSCPFTVMLLPAQKCGVCWWDFWAPAWAVEALPVDVV
jgi:hypothetical protein